MLLGAIMNELKDEQAAEAALASLGDIVLLAGIDEMRAVHDETRGEYVSAAAQRFARMASDEDWLQLMTALERTQTPAATCLTSMLRWSVSQDRLELAPPARKGGCGCNGGESCDGHT